MFAYAGQLPDVLRLFFMGRFYLLFGVGFDIFLRSAALRSGQPRMLLLRRFAALGVLHLLQPGCRSPSPGCSRSATCPAGRCSRGPRVDRGGSRPGWALLPGLFALGFALAKLWVHETLDDRPGRLVVLATRRWPRSCAATRWRPQS